MHIQEPYARMISPLMGYYGTIGEQEVFSPNDGIAMLRKIEWAARISHRSEDAITPDSYEKIIRSICLQHGDMSVTEHSVVTVEAFVDRGITHEWVRHRLFSYTQESTRFVNYLKKILPKFIRPLFTREQKEAGAETVWEVAIEHVEDAYVKLLQAGCTPQIARSVFPNALGSKIVVTGNLRSWRHFFIMRTSKEAHPQMRQVTIPLLREFQATIPILFEDIVPETRQADNMRLLR